MKQFEDKVGYLLAQVCKAHRQCAGVALNEHGVHVGQEMILMQLYCQEGLPQSQLVEALGVEPPTVTKMLQRMEAAGLVERRQDPEDARVSLVYLTEQGRQTELPLMRSWEQLEERFVAGLTDMEKALLRRLLMQVLNNLNSQ
ncbi:MAG: MarR family transcriptional regulator [Chloroflexota bacterium]|nr:MarR family transcriptional regulator [Chloroflexota bacterium]MDQ5865089.1 MarR family transcriptional regulator [Chloroflexota bacterium]